MDDQEFTKGIVQEWAKSDPRGFMQLIDKRLPKVQAVDQDLQRTLISLKSMMLDLPEVEDIALALKNALSKIRKLESEVKDFATQNEFLVKQNKDLKCQIKS